MARSLGDGKTTAEVARIADDAYVCIYSAEIVLGSSHVEVIYVTKGMKTTQVQRMAYRWVRVNVTCSSADVE